MSALGQKQTCAGQKVMSALPPKADICGATRDVRFVPKADIASKLVRAAQNVLRNSINADLSPSVKPGSSVNLLVPK